MGATGPVNPADAARPAGSAPGRAGGSPTVVALAIARAPFTGWAWRELLFCAIEVPLGFCVLVFPIALTGLAARGDAAALPRPGTRLVRPGSRRRGHRRPRRCGHRRCAGAALAGAPDRPRARRGPPAAGGAAAGRADRRAATRSPWQGCRRPAGRHGARRPGLAGHGVPAGQAAGDGGRALRRVLRGRRAGQPDLPVLVAAVPQPSPGCAAGAGLRAHTVRGAAHRNVPRHVRRLRGGRRDDAGRPVGGPGGQLGGPLAHARPARAGTAGAAGRRPGAVPGAGGGRLRRHRCAGSNGTCTTARRSGWPPSP